jgi:3-oxoacyl-[acyl-carrier protein] reductase
VNAVGIDLAGRVALVTGSTRGIGRVTAELFLDAGSTVVFHGRAATDETAALIAHLNARHPGRVSACYGDVGARATVEAVGAHIRGIGGRLDILVNNAGILRDALVGMIPGRDVDDVIDTNVIGVLRMTQLAARFMTRQKRGSIINLSSIIGRFGNPGQLVYGASKAAVIGATTSAAKELAPKGVRVNAVAPGLIDTDMISAIPPTGRQRLEGAIGMARIGTADDVAKVILFLASDLSAYVTGQVIGVDGGLIL